MQLNNCRLVHLLLHLWSTLNFFHVRLNNQGNRAQLKLVIVRAHKEQPKIEKKRGTRTQQTLNRSYCQNPEVVLRHSSTLATSVSERATWGRVDVQWCFSTAVMKSCSCQVCCKPWGSLYNTYDMCTMNSRCIYHTKKGKTSKFSGCRETVGTRWVPNGKGREKKKTIACWIFHIVESNQWRGSFQGADEEYLCLIILAQKLMWGGGGREKQTGTNQVWQDGDIRIRWKDVLRAQLGIFILPVTFFLLLLERFLFSQAKLAEYVRAGRGTRWKM